MGLESLNPRVSHLPSSSSSSQPQKRTPQIFVEYKVSKVLLTPFTLLFFLFYIAFTASIFLIVVFLLYYQRDQLNAVEISAQLIIGTFVDNFLMVLLTSPFIYFGARTGRVSFLEETALSSGIFWFLPLRIRPILLRAAAMGLFADVLLVSPVLIVLWSLCGSNDEFCHYHAPSVGWLGLVWLVCQNMVFFPFVFAAGLNKQTVSPKVLDMGIENAKKRNAPMRNSALVSVS